MAHEYLAGTVGERLRDLLQEKKMTQEELAAKVGISTSTMTRIIKDGKDISHPVLLKLSKALGVSVDFLLCNTNVPYRTNFDIEELGLTPAAAAKLYSGELDPHIVSQLLENKYFPRLVEEIRCFVDGTNSAGFATYNQVLNINQKLLQHQGKTKPHEKAAAKAAMQELKDRMVPPVVPEMTMIRTAFELVLNDLRRQADEHAKGCAKLTGDIMTDMIQKLEKRKGTLDIKQITINDLSDAIVEQVDVADMDAEQKEKFRSSMLELFSNMVAATGQQTKKR